MAPTEPGTRSAAAHRFRVQDRARGCLGVAPVCSQHVVDALYVESTVVHPGSSQSRPCEAREVAPLPDPGGPYWTRSIPRAFVTAFPLRGTAWIRGGEWRREAGRRDRSARTLGWVPRTPAYLVSGWQVGAMRSGRAFIVSTRSDTGGRRLPPREDERRSRRQRSRRCRKGLGAEDDLAAVRRPGRRAFDRRVVRESPEVRSVGVARVEVERRILGVGEPDQHQTPTVGGPGHVFPMPVEHHRATASFK